MKNIQSTEELFSIRIPFLFDFHFLFVEKWYVKMKNFQHKKNSQASTEITAKMVYKLVQLLQPKKQLQHRKTSRL